MTEFDKAMITILKSDYFGVSETELKMLPSLIEKISDFITDVHEVIQDFTEDKPLTKVMLGYMVRELACCLADINNPKDLDQGE